MMPKRNHGGRARKLSSYRRKLPLQWLGGLSLALFACGPQAGLSPGDQEDDIASLSSELVTRMQGSTIASPNVDKAKTYLSVRSIGTLESVGALSGALATLARRVDGVIGAKPADGRFSVAEILRMEQPAYIRTLFPEERAALPALWALLETTPLDPTAVNVANLPTFAPVDASTAATKPLKPPKLAISSLPSSVLTQARRLEMVVDSDGDRETITEADIDDPLGDPDPWTEDEIDAFKAIKQLFIARAGTTLKYALQVPPPFSSHTTVATWGGASLEVEQSLRYEETRSATFFRGASDSSLDVYLNARRASRAVLNLLPGQSLVLIDINSETERLVSGELNWEFSGTVVAEVWSGGTRLGSYRAALPKIASVDERVDLKDYIDYQLVSGATPLVKNATTAAVRYDAYYTQYSASFTFDTAALPRPAGVDSSALDKLVTPKSSLMPGRYEMAVSGLAGTCKLEISPEGVVSFTRPGGAPARASMYIWSYTKFNSQYPDRLRALFDPRTNNLNIFFDGAGSLFNATITDTHRTG
ncbi:MAG TPA: hypothetical protein PLW65_11560 [Pseudomonadota bacterium]|nr:hypothetical protein [Pseudomonadota bacterium]